MLLSVESSIPQSQNFLTPKSLVYVINSKLCCSAASFQSLKEGSRKLGTTKRDGCETRAQTFIFPKFQKSRLFFSSFVSFSLPLFISSRVWLKKSEKGLFLTPDFIPIFSRIRSSSLSSREDEEDTHSSLPLRVLVHVCVCACACECECVRVCACVLCKYWNEKIEPVKKDEKKILAYFESWYTCPISCFSISLFV